MGRNYHLATAPFEVVSIDIVGASAYKKTSAGNTCILTIICHFTSWPEAIPLPDSQAATIADALWRTLICRHGVPRVIVSDQGRNLTGHVLSNLHKRLGTKAVMTTPYHPQSNGKVERFHRTLNNSLATLVNKSHSNWDKHVDSVLFAYRTAVLDFVNDSPFFLTYGRDARLPTDSWSSADKKSPPTSNLRLNKADQFATLRLAQQRLFQLMTENKEKALAKFTANKKTISFLAW